MAKKEKTCTLRVNPGAQKASSSLNLVFLSQGGFLMEWCNDFGCYERALQENHVGKVQR